jgi:hypothetical protein
MFSLASFSAPSWMSHGKASTWEFTTSESVEFDATIFAAGKGSFYITDTSDSDGIVHEILYVGLGLTKSKGPIPFGIGGAFSTPDMPSAGEGPILMKPSAKSLALSDFGGSGLIVTAAGGLLAGSDLAFIFFGIPPFTDAIGKMVGVQYMAPGFGFTAMPCIFTIDP